ncbi:putative CID domain-containing protein [Plasmopara halstedii]
MAKITLSLVPKSPRQEASASAHILCGFLLMAMAQLASSAPTSGTSSNSSTSTSSHKTEIQTLLGQFDAQINTMMDYPAKDTINALTMLAERAEFASEIVSFLETKIHRVAPNCKLPIFYLTDSILKNLRGPYIPLFAARIVPLYCNCVRQVSEKDLKRFIHVLNTWESTQLFSQDAIIQMRIAANHAMQLTGSGSTIPQVATISSSVKLAQQQQDMELRSLLSKLQNDMGIHPTEHMSLEEVRTKNPSYYKQLLEFHAASKNNSSRELMAGNLQRERPGIQRASIIQDFRRPSPPRDARASRQPQTVPSQALHLQRSRPGDAQDDATKSANVAHLMQLLKRKQRTPSPPQPVQEITNDPPRAPDAAAVMSILQKLKGMSSGNAPSRPPENHLESDQSLSMKQTPLRNDHASRMWFSDKIVAHKDRVESNVQKLYAALPLVCRESGLRFREQAQLNAHLDFLFQYNRARKERGKGGVSRSWYPDENQWVADFSGEVAPRECTSSSFFDRNAKENENTSEQALWENARVPVDESITRCRICGENFSRSWDEEEEDWMYTNAVTGTIYGTGINGDEQQETIFHKYCYDTVMSNTKQITSAHLIPAERDVDEKRSVSDDDSRNDHHSGVKRTLQEDDSDSDADDVKRVKISSA